MFSIHLQLPALVVDAVLLDDARDEAQARVGGVDAHGVAALEQELEGAADDGGLLLGGRGGVRLPEGGGLGVALGGLPPKAQIEGEKH